jgi:hypothetical protein
VLLPLVLRGAGLDAPYTAAPPLSFAGDPAEAPSPSVSRVIMLLLDGASLDYISPAAAQGRLPNFGRMLDRGATLHLSTIKPTQAAPVWAAVATGKYPPKNGVRSAATYHLHDGATIELLPDHCFAHALVYTGFIREVPNSSAALRAAPLWTILSGQGVTVGITGWPLTYPVVPVRGFLVSDRLPIPDGPVSDATLDGSQTVYPADLGPLARVTAASPDTAVPANLPFVYPAAEDSGDPAATAAAARDRVHSRLAWALDARLPPQVLAVRYTGLDTIGHRFLRYAMPGAFGDVSEAERRRFAPVFQRYYSFIDGELGRAIAALGPQDLLLVVSGFGMEPVSLGKRLLARTFGDPDLSGTHEGAPDGFLLAYGQHVVHGTLPLGAIVDVAPTVLYYLGLPVGRDMDGHARTDLFTRAFTSERPLTFIPGY